MSLGPSCKACVDAVCFTYKGGEQLVTAFLLIAVCEVG